jgi:hypothetical protein
LPALTAADVDGNWIGSINTPFGDVQIGFTFKTNGATPTGSMTSPDGLSRPISNGKIEGSNLTFDINGNGNSPHLSYAGVMDGDQIKISWEVQGRVREVVLKKVK